MQDIDLQKFLLSTLGTLASIGATTSFLLQQARVQSWPQLSQPDLEANLRTLADAKFVISYTPPLMTQRWKITPDGEVQLRILGLA